MSIAHTERAGGEFARGLVVSCVLLVAACSARGDTLKDLGAGWRLTVPTGTTASALVLGTAGGTTIISISVNHPDYAPRSLLFERTAAGTGTVLVDDMSITNSTGKPWGAYRWSVLGGTALLDEALFDSCDITPFTTHTASGLTAVASGGGKVPAGGVFTPGLVRGQIVIDGATFTLRLLPAIAACNKADLTDGSGTGSPDGTLSASDVVAFFQNFFAPCTSAGAKPCNAADITDGSGAGAPDGFLSGSDVVVFFQQFFAACTN